MITNKFLIHITPLKITAIVFVILAIKWAITVNKLTDDNLEPGLGGLVPMIYGFYAFIAIFIDLFLKYVVELKFKTNLITQLIIVGLLFGIYVLNG